ncbi:MAG: beta-galactosidase [Atopobiaceae bacterium]|nr:beta-galactosidase [Atopobiaceae bacterium]
MIKVGIDYYPEHWDRSMWETDVATMEAMGVDVVRVAEFAWGVLEPADGKFDFGWLDDAIDLIARHGMKVILGTPTNCAPRWLYQNHPDTLQWDGDGQPTNLGVRGHRCQESTTFRTYAARIVTEMCKRYAGRPEVFAWQIDNEVEINHCTCPTCTARFREWVGEKYHTLDEVNKAWGTVVWSGQFQSWDQITPPLMRQGEGFSTGWYNPAYYLDYERFCADSTAGYVRFQSDLIRSFDPDATITTNTCFGGTMMCDLHKEAASLDVASYDNYPPVSIPDDAEETYSNAFGLDLIRGLKQGKFWIMEQLGGQMGCWAPISPALEPGMLEGYGLQAVAHGADLLSFFRWRTASTGAEMFCHGLLDHADKPNSRTRALESLIARLATMPGLADTTAHAQVAMLYGADQEFSLRDQPQSEDYHYWTQLKLIHAACMNLGVDVDVIDQAADLSGYDVVIAPELMVCDPEVVAHLEEAATRGASMVVTCRSGVKDMNGNCIVGQYLPTLLAPLCGCHVLEYDPIGPRRQTLRTEGDEEYSITSWCDLVECDTATTWARYADRYYEGTPAVTRNDFGKGHGWYVGCVGEKALYVRLLAEVFREQGIGTTTDVPLGVEICSRSGKGGTYTFVFNDAMVTNELDFGPEHLVLAPLEVKVKTDEGWK